MPRWTVLVVLPVLWSCTGQDDAVVSAPTDPTKTFDEIVPEVDTGPPTVETDQADTDTDTDADSDTDTDADTDTDTDTDTSDTDTSDTDTVDTDVVDTDTAVDTDTIPEGMRSGLLDRLLARLGF